ncbi:DUF761 domain-containing protein [Melia azedarach]|uniref:DUF761 domain-containing protein n=1 Tax=Melia azedarach TaxID=155640 RepID=A0ACC1YM40_MELAZ|nr:DUF761 domain-containing protein [Melia azedarach]
MLQIWNLEAINTELHFSLFSEVETRHQESIFAENLHFEACYMEQQSRTSTHGSNENAKGKERVARKMIVEDDERGDINELADAFIKNFRKQLKIQREESIKRRKEMIARGV